MLGYSEAITLRITRERSGYTINEVADYCNISANALNKYENDPGTMPYTILSRLRKLYGIPLDFLITEVLELETVRLAPACAAKQVILV